MELYNEELKDLLASDEDVRKLHIYDDSAHKGILVQGLEEFLVKNANDAIDLLQKGSLKRKIAATKCNDKSR